MAYLTTLWEVTDVVIDRIRLNAGALGINYVGEYAEKRIPRYPAVVVAPNSRTKDIAGMSKFDVAFLLDLWVYHAQMTLTHAQRSKEDLQLVARLEEVLESDYTYPRTTADGVEDSVIFGYVSNESPGLIQPDTDKSDVVVCTMMQWVGASRKVF